MIVEKRTYTDFNGNERTEEFCFHYTEAELSDMEYTVDGGLSASLMRMLDTKDQNGLVNKFRTFVRGAYGKKSADGRTFTKKAEYTEEFVATQAYSDIYMELARDDLKAVAFIRGVLPQNIRDKIDELETAKKLQSAEIRPIQP